MPLHPQASLFLRQIEAKGAPDWADLPVSEAREAFSSMQSIFGDPVDVARVAEVDLPEGFRLRIYHPETRKRGPLPTALYFHGGGWVLGDCDTHDSLCRHLAAESECAVVSVDYRRAPEHRFPGPVEDSVAALRFVLDNAPALGIDARRIAVAGDSAGGNLAAAVALRCRDEQITNLAAQVLLYPVIAPNFETESYRAFAEGYGLTRRSMQWFWQQYVERESDLTHPHASPSFAESLVDLPTTYVITAEYDVLRDEGEAFADQLRAAGVPTTVRRYDGMLHGFAHFVGALDEGMAARDDVAGFLRKTL